MQYKVMKAHHPEENMRITETQLVISATVWYTYQFNSIIPLAMI